MVLVFLFISFSAYSCTCTDRSASELIEAAEVIYAGYVVKTELVNSELEIKTTFKVIETFKGETKDQEYVFTTENGGSCGIKYSVANYYVILTDSLEKRVSSCSGWDVYYPYPINVGDSSVTGILPELRKNKPYNRANQ